MKKSKVVIFILIGFCLAVAVIAGFKVAFPVEVPGVGVVEPGN